MSRCTFAILAAIATAFPAAAQSADEMTDGRFQMQKVPGGIARLDTRSGEITLCRLEKNRIECEAAGDEATALRREVEALSSRIDALEGASDGSSTQELEAAADQLRFFLRTFRDIVREMREDPQGEIEPGRAPISG